MSKKNDGFTPLKPVVRSSRQPNAELRWFASAAIVLATLAVTAVTAVAPTTASAQQAEPIHQPGQRVAVLDVGYVFNNLPEIKAHVGKIQADLKKDEAERKQERDALKQAAAKLKTLKVGTAEYAGQENHVVNLDLKFRLRTGHRYHDLSDADAKIVRDNYQRITEAVRAIATDHNISLVLQFDSKGMDLEQSDSVARGMMSHVVYHDSTINITDTVMRRLEQQSKTSQVATDGGAAQSTNR